MMHFCRDRNFIDFWNLMEKYYGVCGVTCYARVTLRKSITTCFCPSPQWRYDLMLHYKVFRATIKMENQ